MSQLYENIPVEAKVTEWLSKMGWTLQSSEDLKHYKVGGAILNIVESTSDKVPVFINVMCQQARKKQFAADFTAECDRLRDIYKRNRTEVAQKIASLREIVLDSLK